MDIKCMDLLDNILSDEQLNEKISHTQCLKSLMILLHLKKKRISNGLSQKIVYPLCKIYKQENEDFSLQCEVLNMALFVTENSDEELLQIITYLNLQLDQINNFLNISTAARVARLINEIILICIAQNREYVFQENISLLNLEKFLLHVTIQKQNSLRIYVLSTLFPNYLGVLNELHQVLFLYKTFLQCKGVHNLDILYMVINFIDENTLLTNCKSVLNLDDFWQYLENCISNDVYGERKQAIFLLKKCVQIFHSNAAVLKCKIAYLQTTNVSLEEHEKIWQHLFILLAASKEKQLHLVWPSLTLLNSLKHLNIMWQVCVYKNLLVHSQNVVIYFVASHIIQEKIFCPMFNKFFLSAINKNEYTDYSSEMFSKLPIYCNSLDTENFDLFFEDILEIIWTPTSAWCLFSNLFSERNVKTIPFRFIEPLYKLLKQLPHIYIRNGCIFVVLNYFIRHFDWKNNFGETAKLLFILKDYDNNVFIKTISNYIDTDCLNIMLHKIEENVFDEKILDVVLQTIKILKYEHELPILKNVKHLKENLVLVLYANFFETYLVNDMEKFALKHLTNVEEGSTEMFLSIITKLMQSHVFSEIVYQKVFLILNDPKNFSKTTVFISLYVLIFCKKNDLEKYMTKNLKAFFNSGKIDDSLNSLFLKLYFLTEKYPEIPFLEDILNNHSDITISEMFECLSTINFHKDDSIDVVYFVKNSVSVLPNLVKSRKFKRIISNYINCIFSISFLETLHSLNMMDVITLATDTLLSLSESFSVIDYYLSKKIKETLCSPNFPSVFSIVLIPVVQNLLLRGVVVKKDDRVEYYVCQEVCEKAGNEEDNPNMIKISTRMSALEVILKIIEKNPNLADDFTAHLMEKYRMYFGKRYFPDSQIHIQKLRIVQALLAIHPAINIQRQPLVELIVESFSSEIHQPCVKQLMQWLLLSLLKDQKDFFGMIKSKIDGASKTQPSSIAAFIVVLLHLTLCREESYWGCALEAFIPWSMGAHFKLRVYSQAAIRKLLEEAKQKHYKNFLTKYDYLEKSIVSIIAASGHAFYETLKSDELFFSTFIPEKNYSLESIYIDIPKLNGVTRTEWENITQYKFITLKTPEIINKDRTFSSSVNKSVENNDKKIINEDMFENVHNIQRKIIPWKNSETGQENNKYASDFILIASLVDKSTNLGGLSRTCEVFGVKQLVLNNTKILKDKEFKSLSMSSEDWIDAVEVKIAELKNFIFKIRNAGYSVIGAEQTSQSIPLHKYKFHTKTALVLGNEKEGIPPDVISILDDCIEIPQFGMVRSLNVHVAGATFIWEYAKQHLAR